MPPCNLHRLLADEPGRAADLRLGRRDRLGALARRPPRPRIIVARYIMLRACSSATTMSDGAMLQRLERADRHAELLARLHVLDRHRERFAHRPDRLGGERGDRLVDRPLDDGQRRLPGSPRTSSGSTRTSAKAISAARWPSWVG